MNYYNEHDKLAAQWLKNLIAAGLLPAGIVDGRDIQEVTPDDVRGFTQCHFFAGIGGWSVALQLAGWPTSRPIWTGSCPCQPFSVAGLGKGTDDERHLWPEFRRLIADCNPPVVAGEQVASADGRDWYTGVRSDLEKLGYAVGCADLCASGACQEETILLAGADGIREGRVHVGPAHIRQRLFWVAERESLRGGEQPADGQGRAAHGADSGCCGVVQSDGSGRFEGRLATQAAGYGSAFGSASGSDSERLGNAEQPGRQGCGASIRGESGNGGSCEQVAAASHADWRIIPCGDGKARRIESGTAPLVTSVSGLVAISRAGQTHEYNRVGAIKGIGNAIVPTVAAEFIKAYMECRP